MFNDNPATTFNLHGRIYTIDALLAQIANYCFAYGTTPGVAAKALKITQHIPVAACDTWDLYHEYLKSQNEGTREDALRYMRARLWNVIDSVYTKPADMIKAMETLLNTTQPVSDVNKLGDYDEGQLEDIIKTIDKKRAAS